jgi:hypothetical protein
MNTNVSFRCLREGRLDAGRLYTGFVASRRQPEQLALLDGDRQTDLNEPDTTDPFRVFVLDARIGSWASVKATASAYFFVSRMIRRITCTTPSLLQGLFTVDPKMRVHDDTEADLAALIRTDFGSFPTSDLHEVFIDWLHYKARRIPALPRKVITSAEASAHSQRHVAISKIRVALQTGASVEPWLKVAQTKLLRRRHDVDMMFNDWQISHFHLGEFFQSRSLIKRTGPLLFAHISAAEATLLDVQPHGSWTTTAFLEILLRTNPPALEKYEARNVTPQRLTQQQYANLRAHGTNSAIDIGGRAFMPGIGLFSSKHAVRLVLYANWFRDLVQDLMAKFQADQVPDHLKAVIYASIGVPVRLGAWYSDGALSVIDKNRNGLVLSAMKPLE